MLYYVLQYSRWPFVSCRCFLPWLAARGRVFKVIFSVVQPVVFLDYQSCPANTGHFGACQQLGQTGLVVRSTRYLVQLASYSSSHTAAPRKAKKYIQILFRPFHTQFPIFSLIPNWAYHEFLFSVALTSSKILRARGD